MRKKRAIVLVIDGLGIGELPDAGLFDDVGANSLLHAARAVGHLELPTMARLGLGNAAVIAGQDNARPPVVPGLSPVAAPQGFFGKMAELSPGKDSIYGHWELMGCVAKHKLALFPDGFPDAIVRQFADICARDILGNRVASGTQIIQELGEEHIKTGRLILYTSADSVFQVAAHEEVVPVRELLRICRRAREMLNPWRVGRVIARPFVGAPGNFKRTEHRRDFSLPPPSITVLDLLVTSGIEVFGFGKIDDLFASRGMTRSVNTKSNADTMDRLVDAVKSPGSALLLANCNDTDSVYGHRRDPKGYARALRDVDSGVAALMDTMSCQDLLIICADHGCDPTLPRHTDHTREYVPVIVYSPRVPQGASLGLRSTLADVGKTVSDWLDVTSRLPGTSLARGLGQPI